MGARHRLLPALFLCLLFPMAACSGGGSSTDDIVVPPGAPGLPNDPGTPTPPPPPPSAPAWTLDPRLIDLGKAGAYPSDLATDAHGALYTVDDAIIPAKVLAYPATGGLVTTSITATDLIDSDGTQPAAAPASIDYGGGLFGAFTGDIEIAFERYLFVTVGAGNSSSTFNGTPLRLANLVVIDAQSGAILQTVNLGWPIAHLGEQSGGTPFPVIPQSLPSQVLFVPDDDVPSTGRVYVTMSNGAGDANGLTLWYPGTVQVWHADFSKPQPLAPVLEGRDPLHVTRAFVSSHFNPVGLTRYRNAAEVDYLLLTNAGASKLDANFVAQPQSDAVLEVLDLQSRVWRPELEMNLGPVLPATQRMPLGRDATGRPFAVLSSQTFAAAYVVDLAGLENRPPDPARMGLLRTIDIDPGGSLTPGSGFLPGIGLTSSSRTLVVSSFFPAALRFVSLPEDVAQGPIVVDPDPFRDVAADPSGGFGALVVPRNNVSDVYVVNNGTFDFTTFLPKDNAFVASFTARDGLR